METFTEYLVSIDDIIWGLPLMILILAGGALLTVRLRFMQVHKLPLALKWMTKKESGGEGDVSSFAALCTALSATIGTGNIVGVATAVCTGGPGALFWMLVAAFLGMATKFSEGFLAIKFRETAPDGHKLGGPFYYIEKGLGPKFKWLAKLFSIFGILAGLLGIGTITQVNGITSALKNFFDPNDAHMVSIGALGDYSIVIVISSIVIAACVALVIIGGIKRISQVSQIIVPAMAVIYIIFCVTLILCNLSAVPGAVLTVIEAAFNPRAITGGAVGSVFVCIQKGVARGIFSNEAGLGSAPIAAAAAQTKDPVRQGLVSMTGTFIDTIVLCTMTGLSIVLTGAWQVEGLEGVAVTTYAFSKGLPFPSQVSAFILMICLVFFAFTTILGWDYYSERCLEYLTNGRMRIVKVYRWIYILFVFIGPYMTVSAVWTVADITNGLMAIPNMVSLFILSGVIAHQTNSYYREKKHKQADHLAV
ncbi:alanine or glycine:cation symporter, AGCS family [Eubacterium oxidoreducens]|uniref:Alanine or glycine:cation symporter, AGCS family n=2 Tax=Eubacterium oxidoreducens TaxID=1732 RepID=A0A1G6C8N2_EUBOX|nr:alanine/glycine:cation symporter family protein [Eubacterium oxidoreducens]SDB29198.1 alanine or glycine:cation symporter, AGCS family [Eubacterium oxidoreducens]